MIKNKYINFPFIEISEETKKNIMNIFELEEEKDKIYIFISDYSSSDLNSVTNDYNYTFIL